METTGGNMLGYVRVYEIVDGNESLIYEGSNIITFGFKNLISLLLSDELKINASDQMKLGYFQLGGNIVGNGTSSTESNIFSLSSPFVVSDYGEDSSFHTIALKPLKFTVNNLEEIGNANLTNFKADTTDQIFIPIPIKYRTKTYETSLDFRIKLMKGDCVGRTIKEAGLFIKNPNNYTRDVPLLAAYKRFPNGINKSSSSELIIDWSISFSQARVIDKIFTDIDEGYLGNISFGLDYNNIALSSTQTQYVSQITSDPIIPGLNNAFTIPIGNYLGPSGGGIPPGFLQPFVSLCLWYPDPSSGIPAPVSGDIRFLWKYIGNGYWIYLGYNSPYNQNNPGPYTGPTGGGGFP
jgi:hypothetical protein